MKDDKEKELKNSALIRMAIVLVLVILIANFL